ATGPVAQTNSQVPSGYKWETIRVLVPDSQRSQQRLPQTGNDQRQMGVVVTLLAAVLGIFGLSWTGFKKERRHD
ncbi:MAG: LPXTG cell wall anchor domain-containing protein, partial [Candidatus Limosilactobacillus intestinavium]